MRNVAEIKINIKSIKAIVHNIQIVRESIEASVEVGQYIEFPLLVGMLISTQKIVLLIEETCQATISALEESLKNADSN